MDNEAMQQIFESHIGKHVNIFLGSENHRLFGFLIKKVTASMVEVENMGQYSYVPFDHITHFYFPNNVQSRKK